MSEDRDQTCKGCTTVSARQPAHGLRGAEPAAQAPEGEKNVLMQRVIALDGVWEGADSGARQRASAASEAALQASPPKRPSPQTTSNATSNVTSDATSNITSNDTSNESTSTAVDLSATALEWGGKHARGSQAPLGLPQPKASRDDAEWATHSSIAIKLCEDVPLSILSTNIEDAVTCQFKGPSALTAGSSITSLASLDRALESAGLNDESGIVTNIRMFPASAPAVRVPTAPARTLPDPVKPRMLELPASIVWTALSVFAVCALILVYLVSGFVLCGQASTFDPIGLRCVEGREIVRQ